MNNSPANHLQTNDETNRIAEVYEKRNQAYADRGKSFFTYRSLSHLIRIQTRHQKTLCLLRQYGFCPLSNIRILDVGCGNGNMLRSFLEWGALPENVAGIDLLSERIERAQYLNPNLDIRLGSATELPWPDASFDLVCQHTVFTSILASDIKKQVASEMNRVLSPEGAILWYDFFHSRPSSIVHKIEANEIHTLFPDLNIIIHRCTLSTRIARHIPDFLLPTLYPLLEAIPLLRTHYIGLLKKPKI